MADTFKGIITADGKKRQLPYGNVLETPVSDKTLSTEGAFADAKIVGDKFAKVNETTASLKEDLGNIEKIYFSGNYLDISKIENGKRLNQDGSEVADSNYYLTDFIDVHDIIGTELVYSVWDKGSTGYPLSERSEKSMQRIVTYDKNKKYIRGTDSWQNSFTVTDKDYYIRVSAGSAGVNYKPMLAVRNSDYRKYFFDKQNNQKLYVSFMQDDTSNVDFFEMIVSFYNGCVCKMTREKDESKSLDIVRINEVSKNNISYGIGWDFDGVIKLKDESDFIGGYHGNEIMSKCLVLVDGVVKTSYEGTCDSVDIIVFSDVYIADHSSIAYNKQKIISFMKDRYTIKNTYKSIGSHEIERVRTSLFSLDVADGENGFIVSDIPNTYNSFDSNTTNGTVFYAEKVTEIICAVNDKYGVSIKLKPPVFDFEGICSGTCEKFTGRIKPYIDCYKGASTSNYGVLQTETEYKLF